MHTRGHARGSSACGSELAGKLAGVRTLVCACTNRRRVQKKRKVCVGLKSASMDGADGVKEMEMEE